MVQTMNETQAEQISMKKLWRLWYSVESILNYYNSGDFTEEGAMNAIQDAWECANNLQ